ncbi:Glutathione S-transferase-O-methyltransferase fusion protein 13 [Zostera marina]|uniref:glutathione transferase n=1 Tax=Zostera marina TaxID=29655 RepID=A0A0K9NN74_ZOSMR|nr:Glutathione S-transferase-O-methyltransferase fusion protein 13 [Zostera marina]
MEKEEARLVGFSASPFVLRARIALKIKGISYEFVDEDKRNEFPTLLHAGNVVSESFKIIEYLDATWKGVDLPLILPADPYDRTIVRFWATFIDDKILSAMKLIIKGSTKKIEKEFHEAMQVLESIFKNESQGQSFFAKGNIGYIDISLGSILGWMKVVEKSKNIRLLDEKKTPMLVNWAERFQAHEVVKGMIPEPDKLSKTIDEKTIDDSKQQQEIDRAFIYARQLTFNPALSMTLKVVIELGVLDVIANVGFDKFLSPKEIASKLSIINPNAPIMLNRMLRLLASHNIVICKLKSDGNCDEDTIVGTTLYGIDPISKYFVKNKDGVSLAPMLVAIQDEVYMKSWYYLKEAVMTGGIPFNMAYGMSAFEYHSIDTRFNNLFNKAFFNITILNMKKILHSYNGFESIKKLVDVGGGTGANLNIIISQHPTIKGVNFDLPHVIKNAPLFKGVEHVGGDMFEKVPSGDAIFMKFILHDWSDDHCVKLLKNCWQQLPKNGMVIVCELILPVEPQENNLAFYNDMSMLTLNPGGKERTESEYSLLAKKAGFVDFKVACDVGGMYIMEFSK